MTSWHSRARRHLLWSRFFCAGIASEMYEMSPYTSALSSLGGQILSDFIGGGWMKLSPCRMY